MVINAGRCHYAVGDCRSGETTSATSKEEEKSLDIKKFEPFCSFQSSSGIGLGRHAFPGVGTNSSSSI